MPFARQRKLKDKDTKEVISGLKYAKANSGKNVVTEGDVAEKYYIVIDGRCSVWSPILHEEALSVITQYLNKLDQLSIGSLGFFRSCMKDGSVIEEQDWRHLHKDSEQTFREFLKE